MASYTDLANLAVGTGGLPSGTTVTALRDNPIAIAEGAPGAPRLYGKAAIPRPQQAELAVLTGVTAGGFLADGLHYSGSTEGASASNTWFVPGSTFTIVLLSGTIRIRAQQVARSSTFSTSTCEARLLKNGIVIQTFSLSASEGATVTQFREVDISCVPGDSFRWEVRRVSGGAEQSISAASILASDVYQRIGIPIKASDM